MSRWFAIWPLLAAACDPAWSVQGQVRGPGAAAVRGAGVALRCPGQQDLAAITDREGTFELDGRGPGPSLDCSVVVAAPAYAPVRVQLGEVCEQIQGDPPHGCDVALVHAELSRR